MDEEIRKGFEDLQAKLVETQTKVNTTRQSIDAQNIEVQRAQLTKRQILAFDDGTKMFGSVGRMFVAQEQPAIMAALDESIATGEGKIKELKATEEYLQRAFKEDSDNLRDLLKSRS